MSNNLRNESSPYLLHHANDPVEWYPWGSEALNKAKEENKPIFLSIGYSACHWCHVMQRETFKDVNTAAVLKKYFISIKVDKEERPDLDDLYQHASLLMTGTGGWPLSVFLTSDLKPFYIGTYFPPGDKYGRPGFKGLVKRLGEIWIAEPSGLKDVADDLANAIAPQKEAYPMDRLLGEKDIANAIRYLKRLYDWKNGGFGNAPKFPNVNLLTLLLQRSHYDPQGGEMVFHALTHMSRGGIYDQLGGGFHRYSTDEYWLVPHFEKMLYDNALLASLYLTAYQKWGQEEFKMVCQDTIDYVLRDMSRNQGGFYSAEDADSDGEEGKFYIWQKEDLLSLLGQSNGEILSRYYDISKGNSLPHRPYSIEEFSQKEGLSKEELLSIILQGRQRLFEERTHRPRPFRDEKVITSWNGVMISALAKAGSVLYIPGYMENAIKSANFILNEVISKDGRLLRSYKDGPSDIPGFLEDYAYFTSALLDLYESTFQSKWLNQAQRLMDITIDLFWSPEDSTFLSSQLEGPIGRFAKPEDQAFPSGLAITAWNLLRLSPISSRDLIDTLEKLLKKYGDEMIVNPWGFASLWRVMDLYHKGSVEIVSLLERDHPILEPINKTYIPGLMLFGPPPVAEDLPEIWVGKEDPALYICRNFSCSPPITDINEVKKLLTDFTI